MVRDQRWLTWDKGVPLMGNVELRTIYKATKEFEKVAGFISAHRVREKLFAQLRRNKAETDETI